MIAALLAITPAWAQQPASSDAQSTEVAEDAAADGAVASDDTTITDEIVVTGGLLVDTLQDTPESVAVWQSDDLTDAGMGELQDIFNQTANAYPINNGEGFGIRGINHVSVGTGGTGELGSYYVDGVAITGLAKRVGPMQLWDVNQVEILRGPQTTNVGRNALAGAVVLNTQDPTFRTESRWRAGLADEATWDVAGMVNLPVGESAALRVTAEAWNTDGFVTNPTRGEDDYDARENLTLRGKFLYQPQQRDDLSVLLSLQYGDSTRGSDLVDLADKDAREVLSNLDAFEDNESLVASADVRWRINDTWQLRSITSFLDSDYDFFDDVGLGPGDGDAFTARDSIDRNWAQDVRFEYARGNTRGVAGLYYTRVDNDGLTATESLLIPAELGIPAPFLPFYSEPIQVRLDSPFDFDTTNAAAFTHWSWQAGEHWSFFAGLRYDYEEQDADQTTATRLLSGIPDTRFLPPELRAVIDSINAGLLALLGTTRSMTETDYDAFLPEFGVSYAWSDTVTTSLFYKRGYRAGGAELSLIGRRNEFDPETLDMVELSMRALAQDGRLVLNANVYGGRWVDQQVTVQASDNVFDRLTENVGESEIYGVEVDFSYRPQAPWNLYGSVGFAHTEFIDFDSAARGDLSGNRFSLAPEWTAALGANYRFANGFFVHGDLNYQGEAFGNVDNEDELTTDERTLLNLRVGYETARYSILGYITNATDEAYAISAFRNLDGRVLGKVGDPRQVGVQLVLRY
ncbi:MAG: TonB-dependent receptor [Acidobacteriota bacterium]